MWENKEGNKARRPRHRRHLRAPLRAWAHTAILVTGACAPPFQKIQEIALPLAVYILLQDKGFAPTFTRQGVAPAWLQLVMVTERCNMDMLSYVDSMMLKKKADLKKVDPLRTGAPDAPAHARVSPALP